MVYSAMLLIMLIWMTDAWKSVRLEKYKQAHMKLIETIKQFNTMFLYLFNYMKSIAEFMLQIV